MLDEVIQLDKKYYLNTFGDRFLYALKRARE